MGGPGRGVPRGPPHLECLADPNVGGVLVREKVRVFEALTAIIGQEIEMGNKYSVISNGGEMFLAVEETDCLMRQVSKCLPDCAPWHLVMLYTGGGQQMRAFDMKRDWTCTCCCFNRPVAVMTDVTTGMKIGSITDPFACCDLTFDVRDPNDASTLKANGGCCQWGLCCPLPCGPCAEVKFPVTDAKSGETVGNLRKKVPGVLKFLFAGDVNNFEVEFGGVRDPHRRALLIGLAIFMDFRYFNENPSDDQGGLMDMMGGGGGGFEY